jgi:type IV pilus assembly protein PilP
MRTVAWLLGLALVNAMAVSISHAAVDAPPSRELLDAQDNSPAYNPVGRRDPFRPFTLDIRRPERAQDQLSPLQKLELGQLTVVGTMWAVNPPRAMIEDSVGMGYIVSIGTPIGPAGGVVTAIERQRVVVEEKVVDFYGNEQVNRIVMETPKEEGATSQPGREQK